MLQDEKYTRIEKPSASKMSQRAMEENYVQPHFGTHKNMFEFKDNVKEKVKNVLSLDDDHRNIYFQNVKSISQTMSKKARFENEYKP